MTKSKAYVPFSYKIMIPYLVLVILTEIFIGYYTYMRLSKSSSVLTELNMKMTFQQITNNILYQLEDVQQISDSLFQSTEIQRALVTEANPFDIYKITQEQLLPLLAAPLQLTRNNIRIMLYVKNEKFQEVFKNLKLSIQEKTYNLLYFSRIENEKWFKQVSLENRDNEWMQVDTDQNLANLSLIRKLISFNDYQSEIGYLRISVRLEDLFQSLNSVHIGENSIVRVREKTTNAILYQADPSSKEGNTDSYLTVKQEIQGTNFGLEILVPSQYFLKEARNIRNVTLMVCIGSFFIMLLIGALMARLSNRKMQKIISFVRLLRSGEFGKRIHIPGQDEFAQIAVAFNKTAADIDNLIQTVYLQKIHVKEAELEALQAQINPHFLYNTLSSINSLANMGETDRLCAMVTGLAKFYRLTLNDGRILISLGNELEQVQAYIDIQKIKYANRFNAIIQVESKLLECEVTKLMLQPFVENALKHAWYGDQLSIRIIGKQEGDRIALMVIDNGVGIHPERIRQINGNKALDSGCGIRNVNDRIRLKYGMDYGVVITSILGAGTTVQITLPYEPPTITNQADTSTIGKDEQ